jgi:tRNA nucleotidyltransferase (CCA-adding enzyme)
MYLDMHTGEIVDPYNGLDDLKNGIIRATNPETFVEDPLRVLRIMQLIARKAKTIENKTIALCRSMLEEYPFLSSERVFEEWNKLLLKADKPSVGLQFLVDCGWIKWFPELYNLIGCKQNPEHHPEGDVWQHTLLAVDKAAAIRNQIPKEWTMAFMYGVLLHDTGKPQTTDIITLTAYGHDKEGEKHAFTFMSRLCNDKTLIKKVCNIVELHMRIGQLYASKSPESAWKRLHNKCRLDILAYMAIADHGARSIENIESLYPPADNALELFEKFGEKEILPVLKGSHLIEVGMTPGIEFSILLKAAYDYQIEHNCEDINKLLSYVKKIRINN